MDAWWAPAVGFAGVVVGVVLQEWLQRRHTRAQHYLEERLAVYSELLRVSWQVVRNVKARSSFPFDNPPVELGDDLDRILARVKVVASDEVYEAAMSWEENVNQFYRELVSAKLEHREFDSGESEEMAKVRDFIASRKIREQLTAGEPILDKIDRGYQKLVALIRRESAR